MLKKALESPLDCKKIQPVHPKGNQSWIFIGRTDAEAETPILWPSDATSWLIWKDPGAGKNWGQQEKGMTKDEMVGWHQWFDGHKFEEAAGVGDGQGGLACCIPWSCKESITTEQLNWTEQNRYCLNATFHLSNFKKNTVPYPKKVFFSACISKQKLNNLHFSSGYVNVTFDIMLKFLLKTKIKMTM